MPTEEEIQAFLLLFNSTVGNLNSLNSDLAVFRRFWGNLTTAQKNGIKTQTGARIDTAIAELTARKTEILAF